MKIRRARSGFTLVETVVTAFITLIALVGIHHLLLWISYASGVSGQTTVATDFAQQKMEQLMSAPFAAVAGGNDENKPFIRTWTVNDGPSGSKELAVTITWMDIRGKNHVVDVKTMKADETIIKNTDMFSNIPVGTP